MSLGDPGWSVQLLTTHFDQIESIPAGLGWSIGARRFAYVELHYFGNPGNYEYYLAAHTDAGLGASAIHKLSRRPPGARGHLAVQGSEEWTAEMEAAVTGDPDLRAVRAGTVVNTFGVVDAIESLRACPWQLGVDPDQIRTLKSTAVRMPRRWRRRRASPLYSRRQRREDEKLRKQLESG